jgi:hypothetical protein
MKITLEQQLAAVAREIAMRRGVYPKWVANGKMKQDKAEHELAAMEAVIETVKDYQLMQPKVLALTTVCITLGRRLGMEPPALDRLLVDAEGQAAAELVKTAAELPPRVSVGQEGTE